MPFICRNCSSYIAKELTAAPLQAVAKSAGRSFRLRTRRCGRTAVTSMGRREAILGTSAMQFPQS